MANKRTRWATERPSRPSSDEIVLPNVSPRCGEAGNPVHDHGRDDGERVDEDDGGAIVMATHGDDAGDSVVIKWVLLNAHR